MSDKRTQLIEATIDLFSKEGFWNTSTARISKHAGVATGTLFNYFASKEILIDEIYLQLKREMGDFVRVGYPEAADTIAQFRHVWIGYAHWALENQTRYRLLEQLRLSDLVSQEAQDKLAEELAFMFELIQRAHSSGCFGTLEVGYASMLIHANLEAMVNYAMANHLAGDALEQHLSTGFDLLWNGLTPNSP